MSHAAGAFLAGLCIRCLCNYACQDSTKNSDSGGGCWCCSCDKCFQDCCECGDCCGLSCLSCNCATCECHLCYESCCCGLVGCHLGACPLCPCCSSDDGDDDDDENEDATKYRRMEDSYPSSQKMQRSINH